MDDTQPLGHIGQGSKALFLIGLCSRVEHRGEGDRGVLGTPHGVPGPTLAREFQDKLISGAGGSGGGKGELQTRSLVKVGGR